ncbi:MAG: chaperone ClpB [Clostridiales bacterium]|nr:MAG: chaperone ClpB [Clostridiales bacterium]
MRKCSICDENIAVVIISKLDENGKQKLEGLCLNCASKMGMSPLNDMLENLNMSEDDINNMSEQLMGYMQDEDVNKNFMNMFGGANIEEDEEDEVIESEEISKDSEKLIKVDSEEIKDLPTHKENMESQSEKKSIDENKDSKDDNESNKKDDDKKNVDTKKGSLFEEFFSKFSNSSDFSSAKNKGKTKSKLKTLEKYSVHLNKKAKDGLVDRVVGRATEIDRVVQILNRRNKNNPVLIGEPGVGKTAIAEGLALKIVEGDVPPKIANLQIYLLDLTAVVAGTQFRGQFESRMNSIISEAKKEGNIVLVIDEVHSIVGAGEVMGGVMNAGNILKPALAKGDIQVIGATTLEEYRKFIEKDAALERRFQKVMVDEPTISEAIEIINGIKSYYEDYHSISIPTKVVESAVILSDRYISDRYLPDKAIDVLDEAGAMLNLKNVDFTKLKELNDELNSVILKKEEASNTDNFEAAAEYKIKEIHLKNSIDELNKKLSGIEMSKDDIAKVIEMWTGIPVTKITEEEAEKLLDLENALHNRVIGQDKAVKLVSKAVRRKRAGFKSRKKPASFIFVGPTGVGKTELCKALAEELFGDESAIIRLDMSEYMEKHTVSKLIGSPPGYVGFDEGGQLTERVRRKPYSVILLDEIEKAHQDIFNMLLQILDDGRLTDSHGRTVFFEHTVIIMTSNAGTSHNLRTLGFNADNSAVKENVNSALKEYFRPEFLARVDEKIIFDNLTKENVREIVEIQLKEVYDDCKEKYIELIVNDDVKDYLAKIGYDPKYGARPLRKKIQTLIEDEISELYLRKKVGIGSVIKLTLVDDNIDFNVI